MEIFSATCISPINKALIKYWGKRDENLILPINSSLSITLNTDQMCAKTSIAVSPTFQNNRMWLNGEETSFESNQRILNCLDALKEIAKAKKTAKFPLSWCIHICSENNFPTAAGLASSAAGYACFVYTLATLYGVDSEELSSIARLGSGSACRSLYGGFVEWKMGENENGNDSIAVQVAPSNHWPEMHVLILVVNDARKKTSSTKGMSISVQSSDLLKYRSQHCVPKRMLDLKESIKSKDFASFAEMTMKDSNQFHAVCLDTYPPISYMNDVSHAIVDFIHSYNESRGETKVAYTFDAGPNACLYLLRDEVPNVLAAIKHSFPNDNGSSVEFLKGIPVDISKAQSLSSIYQIKPPTPHDKNLFKYIIHTTVGNGPRKLSADESLLTELGLPKWYCCNCKTSSIPRLFTSKT